MLAALRRHRSFVTEQTAPFEQLSLREKDVLRELIAGKSVEMIARDWVVSIATVRTQVRGVLTKLGVNSQLAAVAKAGAAGWSVAGAATDSG
jgi:DNA-binding NarL/FixJ family response regulator